MTLLQCEYRLSLRVFEGDERQHHRVLVELHPVNDARREHTDRACGVLYLRAPIQLLHRRTEFPPLPYKRRHAGRHTKSPGTTLPQKRWRRDHNPGKRRHGALAFLHTAFDAHPVVRLWHQLGGVLDSVESPLQGLSIGEGLLTHARRRSHGVQMKDSPRKHGLETTARRFKLDGILRRHHHNWRRT